MTLFAVQVAPATIPVPAIQARIRQNKARSPGATCVVFDGFTDTDLAYEVSAGDRFRELHYEWVSSAAEHAAMVRVGPVTTWCFESVGEHTVTLTVYDDEGNSATATTTFEVIDPDAFYQGQKTIAFSNAADWTGAPSGAQTVQTSSFDTVMSYAATNRRLVLRRGDTFTATQKQSVSFQGLWIGAFGAGVTPDARGMFANDPIVADGGVAAADPMLDGAGLDLHVEHVKFTLAGAGRIHTRGITRGAEFIWCSSSGQVAATSAFSYSWSAIRKNGTPHQHIHFAHCAFTDVGDGYAIFGGAEWFSIDDCLIDKPTVGIRKRSNLRVNGARYMALVDTSIDYAGPGGSVIKLYGPELEQEIGRSEWIVIHGCSFTWDHNNHCLSLTGPNNDDKTGELHNVIVDSCTFWAEGAANNAVAMTSARFCVVRNCTAYLDATVVPTRFDFASVQKRNMGEHSRDHWIAHNALEWAGVGGSELSGVVISRPESSGVQLLNNAMHAAGRTHNEYRGSNVPAVVEGNLIDGTDPLFNAAATNDFRVAAASAAVNLGVESPVAGWDRVRVARDEAPNAGCREAVV